MIDGTESAREAREGAERWDRVFLRAIRALCDLRRYTAVIVNNQGGQVNVATGQTSKRTSSQNLREEGVFKVPEYQRERESIGKASPRIKYEPSRLGSFSAQTEPSAIAREGVLVE